MSPSPNDRQNSGISMAEKQQAAEHLNAALRVVAGHAWLAVVPDPVLEIMAAMRLLGIRETR